MRRKLLSGVLAACLLAGFAPAGAAGEAFPVIRDYPGFVDVPDGKWYADTTALCYEVGLMNGKDIGFDPDGMMTVAEAAAIAARTHDMLSGGTGVIENPEGAPAWYTGVMTYMHKLAGNAMDQEVMDLLGYPTQAASRQDFFDLLALAVPEDALRSINAITALPDTNDADVLEFYNAGILTGVNDYGTFQGGKSLTRAEVAAMAARIARPELRKKFTPKAPNPAAADFDLAEYLVGLPAETPYMTAGGVTLTLGDYLYFATSEIDQLMVQCMDQGVSFAWDNTIAGTDFLTYISKNANSKAYYHLFLVQAVPNPDLTPEERAGLENDRNGDTPQLAAKLGGRLDLLKDLDLDDARWETLMASFPAGPAFDAWQTESGQLRARHILVEDKAQADEIYVQLKADPSRFDALQAEYSQDGRDESGALYSTEYTFGPGEMVASFEAGTKALKPNEIGAPVQSDYGWHIIQRLPLELSAYQNALANAQYSAFIQKATQDLEKDGALGEGYHSLSIPSFYDGLSVLRESLG